MTAGLAAGRAAAAGDATHLAPGGLICWLAPGGLVACSFTASWLAAGMREATVGINLATAAVPTAAGVAAAGATAPGVVAAGHTGWFQAGGLQHLVL